MNWRKKLLIILLGQYHRDVASDVVFYIQSIGNGDSAELRLNSHRCSVLESASVGIELGRSWPKIK